MVTALGEEVRAPGLAQRVGIVTGEVAVTVGATAEGMVTGDAVNTAARVQSAASPGQVWVDEATRGLASAAITFTDTGEHALKGKAEPVRLFEAGVVVAEVGGGQRVDGLEAPFTGRDADLRLVKELFHATQESGRPRLVVLDGEAGVGKSRLAWEFFKYVDGLAASTRWHRGRCLSYGDGVAFWALAEAIRARVGLAGADTGSVVTEHLDAGLEQYIHDAGDQEWLRPRLAVLLGEDGAGQFPREDLFAAWTAFLEQLTDTDSTVVLVLDDAQHADDALLDFLDYLLSTARAPIFVLALARPDLLRRRPDLGGRRVTVVRLQPLDDNAMATLVDGLGRRPASRDAGRAGRTGGRGPPVRGRDRPCADRPGPGDLARRPLRHRRARRPGPGRDRRSRDPARPGRRPPRRPQPRREASGGRRLSPGPDVHPRRPARPRLHPQTLDPALDSLRRREIVTVQTDRFSAERGKYRFVQSVVRQVAYATLSRRDRKTRHLSAADHLAAEPDPADDLAAVVAQHLLDAIQAAPENDPDTSDLATRAVHYLERAATRTVAIGAPAKLERLLELALTHTPDPPAQARLHLAAAGPSRKVGRRPRKRTGPRQNSHRRVRRSQRRGQRRPCCSAALVGRQLAGRSGRCDAHR